MKKTDHDIQIAQNNIKLRSMYFQQIAIIDLRMHMKTSNAHCIMNRKSTLSNTGQQHLSIAFGHRHAPLQRDINALIDQISGVTPTLKSYENISDSHFHYRSAFIELKDLTLAATACSAISYEVTEDKNIYFILPLQGMASAQVDQNSYTSSPHHGAFLTHGHHRKGVTTDISMLQATLDPERLRSTALTMAGPVRQAGFEKSIANRFKGTHLLDIQASGLNFGAYFSTICKTIDDCGLQTETLNALGYDDLFYRSVATMAFPELIAHHSAVPVQSSQTALDRVCDYIDAHLTESIYLTDLESISELSTRSLQYAFMRRFGCGPTAWIRQRRLELAHRRLMLATPSETVTSIALDCGFSNSSDFARLYLNHFGVLPKFTLSCAPSGV